MCEPSSLNKTTTADAPATCQHPVTEPMAVQEIFRFLRNPRKPVILAMSRPDAKKNITTLVKAFGENHTLRSIANLVLIMVQTNITFITSVLQLDVPYRTCWVLPCASIFLLLLAL